METNKNNKEGEKKSNPDPANPLGGFDFSKLLQNETVIELLKHLISGGGAMAANYFMWIKPLQDKFDAMNVKITEQDKRIRELETGQEELIEQLNHEQNKNSDNLKGKNEEYFNVNKKNSQVGNKRSYQNAYL